MTTALPTTTLGVAALRRALELPDLTDPAHGPHAMQLVVAAATDALVRRWRCPVVEYRGSPIVSLVDNYEALGYASDAPARDARYTRYVGDGDREVPPHVWLRRDRTVRLEIAHLAGDAGIRRP